MKFYETKWFMWVTLIFFAPVGIYLLWSQKHYQKTASVILSVVFGFIFLAALAGNNKGQQTVKSGNSSEAKPSTTITSKAVEPISTPKKEVVYKPGDTIKTDKLEAVITSIEEKSQVGSEYTKLSPSNGGTYVVVNWQYKNTSDKPIGMFSLPALKLTDKNKTQYDSDIHATSTYSVEKKTDAKVLSDLNPGITVNDAKVFEIAKERYQAGGWNVIIKADKDYLVNIN